MTTATLPSPATLTVRRGARVLFVDRLTTPGVGYVEGESFCGTGVAWIFRGQDGAVRWAPQGLARLVAVDAGTVLIEDQFNNVGRLCNVRGAAGYAARCWQIVAAVSGYRYLVRHLDYGTVVLASSRDMTNVY